MVRSPINRTSSRVIRTLDDYHRAGLDVIAYCGAGCGHRQLLDLAALIAERGADAELDYVFRRSLVCPACEAPAAD